MIDFLPCFTSTGHDLFLEHAGFCSCIRGLLAAQCIRVGICSRDPRLRGQFLRGHRHWQPAIGIRQAHKQKIFQRPTAEFQSGPRTTNHKRRLRHILHAARQHHARFTQQQALRRLRNRFNSRAAQPVHRYRRSLDLQSRLQAHVPRAINRIGTRLQHISKNHVIEFGWIHARTLHRRLRCMRSQFDRGHFGENAGIARHWRARSSNNHNICWKHSALA